MSVDLGVGQVRRMVSKIQLMFRTMQENRKLSSSSCRLEDGYSVSFHRGHPNEHRNLVFLVIVAIR